MRSPPLRCRLFPYTTLFRSSTRQSPPVDAFFLQDTAKNGELGYEVIDFLHGQATFPYVRPDDVQPDESAYLDRVTARSEEHTSELQSLTNLVCRLLLENKKS